MLEKLFDESAICHDCDVSEGELHEHGCDMEQCPFCGGQIITCDCCYKKLNLFDKDKYTDETAYLSPEVYKIGLTDVQWLAWVDILDAKGRIPYIVYPNVCCRCGKLWPSLFMVPKEEWEHYVQPSMRGEVLCRKCYDYIKKVTDKHGIAFDAASTSP